MIRDENYIEIPVEIKSFWNVRTFLSWFLNCQIFLKAILYLPETADHMLGLRLCIEGWGDPGHLHFSILQLLCCLLAGTSVPHCTFRARPSSAYSCDSYWSSDLAEEKGELPNSLACLILELSASLEAEHIFRVSPSNSGPFWLRSLLHLYLFPFPWILFSFYFKGSITASVITFHVNLVNNNVILRNC